MPTSQRTATTRRPILRFDLASISIDDRPNVYKKPQLVLKPQLELAPRRPYTGTKPRSPVWRHFLMVHVKDRADELVKLDLDAINSASTDAEPAARYSIICRFSRCCLVFQYPKDNEKDSSTLSITLQNLPDLDTVLQELGALNLSIEYEQPHDSHGLVPGSAAFGPWSPLEQTNPPLYRSFSNPRQLNSSSPPLFAVPSSQGRYASYSGSPPQGAVLHRPPSQPRVQSAGLQAGQRPWSPAFVPSRPATALGVPGMLGEGIYKVSKIGSTISSRPRVRRTATVLDHQGPKLYTVSRHFDKTLSRADVLHTAGARDLGRGLTPTLQAGNSAERLTRLPSLREPATRSQPSPGQERETNRPQTPMSSALEGIPVNIQQHARPRRLRTINGASDISSPLGLHHKEAVSLSSGMAQERFGYGFSQPRPASRTAGSADDVYFFSSSPTLLEPPPPKHQAEDDWLLQFTQIQHQGLCEASSIWEDFMEKASGEVALAETSKGLSEVLSKYEGEFTRRWGGVVDGTVQRMRGVQIGSYGW